MTTIDRTNPKPSLNLQLNNGHNLLRHNLPLYPRRCPLSPPRLPLESRPLRRHACLPTSHTLLEIRVQQPDRRLKFRLLYSATVSHVFRKQCVLPVPI